MALWGKYDYTNTPYEKLSEDSLNLLHERHERIRKELRRLLKAMLGISTGSIVLSLILLEKIEEAGADPNISLCVVGARPRGHFNCQHGTVVPPA